MACQEIIFNRTVATVARLLDYSIEYLLGRVTTRHFAYTTEYASSVRTRIEAVKPFLITNNMYIDCTSAGKTVTRASICTDE